MALKKSKKATKSCLKREFNKLDKPAKKRKYPKYEQRVAIALSVCGVSKKKKKK